MRTGNRRLRRRLSRRWPGSTEPTGSKRSADRICARHFRTNHSTARSTLNVLPAARGRVLHHLRQNARTGPGCVLLAALQLHDDQLQPARPAGPEPDVRSARDDCHHRGGPVDRPGRHRHPRLLGAGSRLADQPRRRLRSPRRRPRSRAARSLSPRVSAIRAPRRPVPFEVGVYFSADQTINDRRHLLGVHVLRFQISLPGGASTCNGSVHVPGAAMPGNYYVGLLVDRAESADRERRRATTAWRQANPTAVEPNPLDPIVNGSFETGDLTGWTVKELTPASNPNLPLSVRGAGVEYPAPTFIAFPYILDYFTSAAHRRSVGRVARFQRQRPGDERREPIRQPP